MGDNTITVHLDLTFRFDFHEPRNIDEADIIDAVELGLWRVQRAQRRKVRRIEITGSWEKQIVVIEAPDDESSSEEDTLKIET